LLVILLILFTLFYSVLFPLLLFLAAHQFACENQLWNDALVLSVSMGVDLFKQTLALMSFSRFSEGK
jgi:hypothetical protein